MGGFLEEVKAKIYEAKFLLEQDTSDPGNSQAIEKLRNALDMCTVAERLINSLVPRETRERLIADTLSSSLARPKLESIVNFGAEPPTDIKDKP